MRRRAAALLFAAWAAHDAEEWFAVGPWTRAVAEGRVDVPAWARRIPFLREPTSDRRQRAAIVAMGALIGSAAAAGAATRGRSQWYRAGVTAYGIHGVGHLLASVAVRGYTPGVATTPLTVLPYAVWALRTNPHRVTARTLAVAATSLPVSLAVSHAIGGAVERRLDQGWRASNSASATASASASRRTWASSAWCTRSALAARSPQSER